MNTKTNEMTRLEDALELSRDFDLRKSDYTSAIDAIRFHGDGSVELTDHRRFDDVANFFGVAQSMREATVSASGMTTEALRQLCNARLNIPASYLERCPVDLRAINLEHWRQEFARSAGENSRMSSSWFVRLYEGEVRAVLSERYASIPNSDVIEAARDIVGALDYSLIRPYVTPDRVSLKIRVADIDTDDEGGNFGIGVYISNDEVGRGALVATPFIQRHSCTNSITFTNSEFALRMTHKHYSPGFMRGALKDAIGRSLKVGAEKLEEVHVAMQDEIPNLSDVLDQIGAKYRLKNEVVDNMKIGTEGMRTRFGVVNALSYAAHATDDLDQDDREMLESLAGEALTGNFFKRSRDRASQLVRVEVR